LNVFVIIIVLFFSVIPLGNAKPYDVQHDYDQRVDFANFKTFDWMEGPDHAGLDQLVVQRVKNAVNARLKEKGVQISSNKPDFLVAIHLGKKDKVDTTDWGYTYGTSDGYRRGEQQTRLVSAYEYEEGSLILDFVDAKSKQLIWRGSAKAEVQNINTAKKSEQVINKAVKMIMQKFPPPSSK